MLAALRQALLEGVSGDQVSDQVSDQVARLLQALPPGEALKASELMQRLGWRTVRPLATTTSSLPWLPA